MTGREIYALALALIAFFLLGCMIGLGIGIGVRLA